MAREIYIVRHGNTFDKGDTVTRVGARTDLPLSSSGQEQAHALARHFAVNGVSFSQAITGPLKRTRETASIILGLQEHAPALQVAEFLREIDYGPDEDHPEAEVIARIGQLALDLWENEAVLPSGWIADTDQLKRHWRAQFSELRSAAATGPALVVTSNGIARFALLAMPGQAAEDNRAYDLKLKTGAYGILQLRDDGSVAVTAWNVRPQADR